MMTSKTCLGTVMADTALSECRRISREVGGVMAIVVCVVLTCIAEPEQSFRVGVREPGGRVVFFAETEPRDTIWWKMEWEGGSASGFEPMVGVMAMECPHPDVDMKWVAWTHAARDSLFWRGK